MNLHILKEKSLCLSEISPGESVKIISYQNRSGTHFRLQEMGLVKGTYVKVLRLAPLGDPMELELRGFHLSIRKKDAAHILVEKVEDA